MLALDFLFQAWVVVWNGVFIWSIHSLKLLGFKQSQSILPACDKVGMVVVVVCCGTTTESICSQRSFLQGAFNYRLNHQRWLPSYIEFFGGWFPFVRITWGSNEIPKLQVATTPIIQWLIRISMLDTPFCWLTVLRFEHAPIVTS